MFSIRLQTLIACLIFLFGLFCPCLAFARITKIEVLDVESPTFEGQEFGEVGQYEKISGRLLGEVDPSAVENVEIVNLDKAPKNKAGRVAYNTDFVILRPIDSSKGKQTLFYGVLNRGNKIDLVLLNNVPSGETTNTPKTADDAGNGFLMRQGYSIVWSGWQLRGKPGAQCCVPDKPGIMGAELPVALENKKPISGSVRDLFVGQQQTNPPDHETVTLSYPVASLDPKQLQVSVRAKATGEKPHAISFCHKTQESSLCWQFDDGQTVRIRGGLQSGFLYELHYQAKNPPVLGLGFAITRDVVSFLRYETADDSGTANPLRHSAQDTGIKKALAFGISQAGRYLQEHVWAGFNQDEQKRIVFDGLIADIGGAGKTFTNFPFGQPGRTQGGHQDFGFPENWFPFAYGGLKDPLTGKQDAILRTGSGKPGDGFDPLILVTNTASEYWRKSAALLHTDGQGNDISIPDSVRLYFFASTQHFALFNSPITTSLAERLPKGPCQHEHNPAFRGPVMRALLVALQNWVYTTTLPPKSQIPTRKEGTLVTAEESIQGFPPIPGVTHVGRLNPTFVENTNGTATQYTSLVAKTDADGNDLAGIRVPDIAVPLGTHTGWGVRADVLTEMRQLCGNWGQFVPFAKTKTERQKTGDPRLSLAERYPTKQAYIDRIRHATQSLQDQGLLLAEDAAAYIADAERKAPVHD